MAGVRVERDCGRAGAPLQRHCREHQVTCQGMFGKNRGCDGRQKSCDRHIMPCLADCMREPAPEGHQELGAAGGRGDISREGWVDTFSKIRWCLT